MIWPWTPYAGELREINKIRKSLGHRPITRMPKGALNSATYCPVAKAIDQGLCSVGLSMWSVWPHEYESDAFGIHNIVEGELPSRLQCFVEGFDAGAYPDLIG